MYEKLKKVLIKSQENGRIAEDSRSAFANFNEINSFQTLHKIIYI